MKDINYEINELIQAIDQTTLQFYQQHVQEGYSRLDETLTKLFQTISDIAEYKQERALEEIDIDVVNSVLNDALYALEEKDTVLFSDILVYELKDFLVQMQQLL